MSYPEEFLTHRIQLRGAAVRTRKDGYTFYVPRGTHVLAGDRFEHDGADWGVLNVSTEHFAIKITAAPFLFARPPVTTPAQITVPTRLPNPPEKIQWRP